MPETNVRNSRSGTAAQLAAANRWLEDGETVVETDTGNTRTGPGHWNDLTPNLAAGGGDSGASGAEWVTLFDLSTETDLSKFTTSGVNAWSIAGHVITWNGADGDSGVLTLNLTDAVIAAVTDGVLLEMYYTAESRITAALPSGSSVTSKVQRGINGVEYADDGTVQGLAGNPVAAGVNTWYQVVHQQFGPEFEVGQAVGIDPDPLLEEHGGVNDTSYLKALWLSVSGDDGTIGLQVRNAKISALVLSVPALPT